MGIKACLSKHFVISFLYRLMSWTEMMAASACAEAAGIPVILGDQAVQTTMSRISNAHWDTLRDLVVPHKGGWTRLYADLAPGVLVPSCTEAVMWLDPCMVLSGPASIFRYQCCMWFSFLKAMSIKLLVQIFLYSCLWFALFAVYYAGVYFQTVYMSGMASFQLADLAFYLLILIVIVRVKRRLLHERDAILSQQIVEACSAHGAPGKVIVAVLGAAHCDGVHQRILCSGHTGMQTSCDEPMS